MKTLVAKLYGLWFLVVFVFCATGAVLLALLLPGEHRRRRAARSAARWVFLLTGSFPSIRGLERLPEEPSVIVANHASYLDGVLMTAALPDRFRFVIKREMTDVPVAHFLLRRVGAHFVERSDSRRGATDIRNIMQTADSGGSLVFFPEGTFRPEAGLRRFRNGAFAVAFRNNLPLVPVAISGTREMLPANRLLPAPGSLSIEIHPMFQPAAHQSIDVAIMYCRDRIMQSTGEPDLQSS
ncbi:MAG: 1-acyl-sn-glycerol-3-phosphate acyltransferase [Gammaproteobacteria bacterium]|nr:1-acyl-sn-glycerol-3-phosphate acyltransferase [Gammaproteobacteria bacterium]